MVSFIPFEPTDEQRANLLALAGVLASPNQRHILAPSTDFEMSVFYGQSFRESADPECDTVACACGWGPYAGIAPLPDELDRPDGPAFGNNVNWLIYAGRAFNAPRGSDAHYWLFSGGWAGADNTPEGAAKRIEIALAKGIPENFDDFPTDYFRMALA